MAASSSDAVGVSAKEATAFAKAAITHSLSQLDLDKLFQLPEGTTLRLSPINVLGECSVTRSRHGKVVFVYELALMVKWQAEVKLEAETKKELEIPWEVSGDLSISDISAESIDDLEVVFTTTLRGTPLSELMRKLGCEVVKRSVVTSINLVRETVEERCAKAGGGGGADSRGGAGEQSWWSSVMGAWQR